MQAFDEDRQDARVRGALPADLLTDDFRLLEPLIPVVEAAVAEGVRRRRLVRAAGQAVAPAGGAELRAVAADRLFPLVADLDGMGMRAGLPQSRERLREPRLARRHVPSRVLDAEGLVGERQTGHEECLVIRHVASLKGLVPSHRNDAVPSTQNAP